MFEPKIEFPLICERPGNPYRWVPLHTSDRVLTIPKVDDDRSLYLFSFNGKQYELVDLNRRTISELGMFPFTHWFTKPINPLDRVTNHISPIVMDDGVEYLVSIHEKLHFISTYSIFRDSLPITWWINERDLFPL